MHRNSTDTTSVGTGRIATEDTTEVGTNGTAAVDTDGFGTALA